MNTCGNLKSVRWNIYHSNWDYMWRKWSGISKFWSL